MESEELIGKGGYAWLIWMVGMVPSLFLSLMASGLGGGVGEGETVPGTAGPPLGEELVLDAQLGVQDGPGHEVSLLHIVHVLQDPASSIAGH